MSSLAFEASTIPPPNEPYHTKNCRKFQSFANFVVPEVRYILGARRISLSSRRPKSAYQSSSSWTWRSWNSPNLKTFARDLIYEPSLITSSHRFRSLLSFRRIKDGRMAGTECIEGNKKPKCLWSKDPLSFFRCVCSRFSISKLEEATVVPIIFITFFRFVCCVRRTGAKALLCNGKRTLKSW